MSAPDVVLADDGVAFDGATPAERPLGGAESAFIALGEAMASLGARVEAVSRDARPMMTHAGVRWRPLSQGLAPRAGLYVANRSPRLLRESIRADAIAFWLHNPAGFLAKPRYLLPILVRRPHLIFAGPSHARTAPSWVPAKSRLTVPLGVEAVFLDTARPASPPPPRAVFLSNPLRGLDRLVDLWVRAIRPLAPGAELHVFSGPATYGGGPKAHAMEAALAHAQGASGAGVVLRAPLAKAALAQELATARVLIYLGDSGETFCLAVAEAQAMGVPAVVKPVGAVGERVIHDVTGFVEAEDAGFAARAAAVLTDDGLFARLSAAALARRGALSWTTPAKAFLKLAPFAPQQERR